MAALGVVGWNTWEGRVQETLLEVRQEALGLSEHAATALGAVDLLGQDLAHVLEARGSLGAWPASELHDTVRRRRSKLGLARDITVIGVDGTLVAHVTSPEPPDLNLRGEPFFLAHRANPRLGLHIARPMFDPSTGTWAFSLSRRLNDLAGQFAGVVMAAGDPTYFRKFYDGNAGDTAQFYALIMDDGTVLASSSSMLIEGREVVGRPLTFLRPIIPAVRSANIGSRLVKADVNRDGVNEYVALYAVPDQPLVVMAGVSQPTIMMRWMPTFWGLGAAALAMLIATAAFVAISHRAVEREEHAIQRLRAAEGDLQSRIIDLQDSRDRLERQGRQLAELADSYAVARDQAQEATHAKSEFLAKMSHELRTPLNAILGFSEIIRTELFGRVGMPQYKSYADDIYRSGSHLLDLINDILDIARIEAGKLDLRREHVSLTVLLNDAIRLFRRKAEEQDVQLELSVEDDLPPLYVDRRAVKQMLLNLLSNALKFTPDGGEVRIAARRSGDGLIVSVTDSGIGISPEEIEKVLRPFEQASHNDPAEHGGTGLGLPIVRSLVELHGGKLVLTSSPGEGTTVTLSFPAKSIAQVPLMATASGD